MPSGDWQGTPYVRVYRTLRIDHPRVWTTPALLGWYVRLLTIADGVWPAPAELPGAITDDVVAELVDEGIIELVDDSGFVFHGLDAERSDRRDRGVAGGKARARTADRDRGRFAGRRAGDDSLVSAGDPIEDDDETRWSDSLVAVAGEVSVPAFAGTSDPTSEPAIPNRTEPNDDASASSSFGGVETPPGRADAREAEPVGEEWQGGRRQAPTSIDCDDYRAHQLDHRFVSGVGWKCLVCEQRRSESGPSFRERVEAASGGVDERPF